MEPVLNEPSFFYQRIQEDTTGQYSDLKAFSLDSLRRLISGRYPKGAKHMQHWISLRDLTTEEKEQRLPLCPLPEACHTELRRAEACHTQPPQVRPGALVC